MVGFGLAAGAGLFFTATGSSFLMSDSLVLRVGRSGAPLRLSLSSLGGGLKARPVTPASVSFFSEDGLYNITMRGINSMH